MGLVSLIHPWQHIRAVGNDFLKLFQKLYIQIAHSHVLRATRHIGSMPFDWPIGPARYKACHTKAQNGAQKGIE